MIQLNRILRKKRVLFVIKFCEKCQAWEQFIMRVNAQLPPEKMIKVIDATAFNLNGTYTHPLLKLFDKHLDAFPSLFFNGRKIDVTNTKLEAESYIRSATHKDFKVTPPNIFMSDKDCYYIKKGLFGRKTVICD